MMDIVWQPISIFFLFLLEYGRATEENVALGKATFQSSTEGPHVSARAVDGGVEPYLDMNICAQTTSESNPWWAVDLRWPHRVDTVYLYSHRDREGAEVPKLWNVTIGWADVSPEIEPPTPDSLRLCDFLEKAIEPGWSTNYVCSDPVGRYLVVLWPGEDRVLTLCEVKVMANRRKLHFEGHENCRLHEDFEISRSQVNNEVQCGKLCKQNVQCTSFNIVVSPGTSSGDMTCVLNGPATEEQMETRLVEDQDATFYSVYIQGD